MRAVGPGAIVVTACLVGAVRGAHAQTAPQAAGVARSEFARGVADTEADRWDAALGHFARAYTLMPQPRILLNLAGAQARTSHFVASAESYRRFLHDAQTASLAPLRASAQEALDAVLRRTPHVRLTLAGVHPIDRIALDDVVLAHTLLGVALPVDPGPHALRVTRGLRAVGAADFALDAGAERAVRLVLLPLPDPRPAAAARERTLASPWLWTGVGAGVAAVVGTVVAVVLATRPHANGGAVTDSTIVPELTP